MAARRRRFFELSRGPYQTLLPKAPAAVQSGCRQVTFPFVPNIRIETGVWNRRGYCPTKILHARHTLFRTWNLAARYTSVTNIFCFIVRVMLSAKKTPESVVPARSLSYMIPSIGLTAQNYVIGLVFRTSPIAGHRRSWAQFDASIRSLGED